MHTGFQICAYTHKCAHANTYMYTHEYLCSHISYSYICTHIHICAHICTYVHASAHICAHMQTLICALIQKHAHRCSQMYACAQLYTHTHTFLSTHVRIYSHTHIYTPTCVHTHVLALILTFMQSYPDTPMHTCKNRSLFHFID